jgi:hypothetical protein
MMEPSSNRWRQREPTPEALNPVPCRCIASECMAWRWEPDNPKPIEQHRGFCGLAGLSTDLPLSQVRA